MNTKTKYLPLDRGHIVPITGLSPDDLKESSQQTFKDREPISHTTILNAISSAFGCQGGFSKYSNFYSQELLPFLKENKLYKHTNLLENAGLFGLKSWQDLSERLFYSNMPIFEKIYISKNDFSEFDILNAHAWFNELRLEKSELDQKLYEFHQYRSNDLLKELCTLTSESTLIVNSKFSIQEVREKILSLYRFHLSSIGLLDDTLCLPNLLPADPVIYFQNDYLDAEKDRELYAEINRLYALYIYEKKENWHTIISFNEKLVFIVNNAGEYDFVFKNQRDNLFKHCDKNTGKPIKDLPHTMKSKYFFDRWFYFVYKGWRELDSHKAEQYFYEDGGKTYEWTSDIYRKYYMANQIYSEKKHEKEFNLPFFKKVTINAKTLMVSDLITIHDLNSFLDRNPNYLDTRNKSLDSLLSSNLDDNTSLPASLTWFDVLSYIKDMEERFKINFRLLNLEEFLILRGRGDSKKLYPHWNDKYHTDTKFRNWYESFRPTYQLHGKKFNKSEYIESSVFQNDVENYFNAIELDQTIDELTFVTSPFFAEWLMGETCIRSADLSSFSYDPTDWIPRVTVPEQSNGKYKDLKIGFRLCYAV